MLWQEVSEGEKLSSDRCTEAGNMGRVQYTGLILLGTHRIFKCLTQSQKTVAAGSNGKLQTLNLRIGYESRQRLM